MKATAEGRERERWRRRQRREKGQQQRLNFHSSSKLLQLSRRLPSTATALFLLLLLLGVAVCSHPAAAVRRSAREASDDNNYNNNDAEDPPSSSSLFPTAPNRNTLHSAVRANCPKGCFCVPDGVHSHLLVVSCRSADGFTGGDFGNHFFQRNLTKVLSITCTTTTKGNNKGGDRSEKVGGGDSLQLQSTLSLEGFDALQELRISGCTLTDGDGGSDRGQAVELRLPTSGNLRSLQLRNMPRLTNTEHALSSSLFTPLTIDRLANLEKLVITGTGLNTVPLSTVLCRLSKLQVLNVSSNRLSSLFLGGDEGEHPPPNCLLDQLFVLDASGNRISALGARDLAPFPSLRQLSLAGNNLKTIARDAFQPLSLLQHLDLAGNALGGEDGAEGSTLDTENQLPTSLVHVNLARNQLRWLPRALLPLAALNSLSLAGNQLSSSASSSSEEEDDGEEDTTKKKEATFFSSLEHLDLSRNFLGKVPGRWLSAAANLRVLNLARNQIAELRPGQLANLSRIYELDLSGNSLESLPARAFEGLRELNVLRLDDNRIKEVHNDGLLPVAGDPAATDNNGAEGRRRPPPVTTLSLAGNQLPDVPPAIGRLARVRRLDLSRNQITSLPAYTFNKLPHLSRLDLSSNHLVSVDGGVFTDSTHLSECSLRENRIASVAEEAFSGCHRLKRLDLSGNRLSTAGLGPALSRLHSLDSVNISGNVLDELHWGHFPDELVKLVANNNRVRRLVGRPGPDRVLRRLELRSNTISELHAGFLPPSLEDLDLSKNLLSSFPTNSEGSTATAIHPLLPALKWLDLRENRFLSLSRELFELVVTENAPIGRVFVTGNPLECSCRLDWLVNGSIDSVVLAASTDLADVECTDPLAIGEAAEGRQRRLIDFTPGEQLCAYDRLCGHGCICCGFPTCDCESRCPRTCRCYHDTRSGAGGGKQQQNVVLCIGNNNTSSATDKEGAEREGGGSSAEAFDLTTIPAHATKVLIRGVKLPRLKSHSFFGRVHLRELHINASGLSLIEPLAFNTLPNLEIIRLSGNRLRRVNGDEGFNTTAVTTVDLTDNAVQSVDPLLGRMMPRLQRLQLAGNQLVELPTAYLETPTAVEHLRSVTLGGNPFRCECSSSSPEGRFPSQRWISRHRELLVDAVSVLCVENVTHAKQFNDTTILSWQFPNTGDDLFVIPMFDFLATENDTFCAVSPTGLFGGGPVAESVLLSSLLVAVSAIAVALVLALLARCCLRGRSRCRGRGRLGLGREGKKPMEEAAAETGGGHHFTLPPRRRRQGKTLTLAEKKNINKGKKNQPLCAAAAASATDCCLGGGGREEGDEAGYNQSNTLSSSSVSGSGSGCCCSSSTTGTATTTGLVVPVGSWNHSQSQQQYVRGGSGSGQPSPRPQLPTTAGSFPSPRGPPPPPPLSMPLSFSGGSSHPQQQYHLPPPPLPPLPRLARVDLSCSWPVTIVDVDVDEDNDAGPCSTSSPSPSGHPSNSLHRRMMGGLRTRPRSGGTKVALICYAQEDSQSVERRLCPFLGGLDNFHSVVLVHSDDPQQRQLFHRLLLPNNNDNYGGGASPSSSSSASSTKKAKKKKKPKQQQKVNNDNNNDVGGSGREDGEDGDDAQLRLTVIVWLSEAFHRDEWPSARDALLQFNERVRAESRRQPDPARQRRRLVFVREDVPGLAIPDEQLADGGGGGTLDHHHGRSRGLRDRDRLFGDLCDLVLHSSLNTKITQLSAVLPRQQHHNQELENDRGDGDPADCYDEVVGGH